MDYRRRLPAAISIALILMVTAILYAPSLSQWFFADDFLYLRTGQVRGWHAWIFESFDFRHPRPVTTWFLLPAGSGRQLAPFANYRPLYLITFKTEFTLFGLSAPGYHAVNLCAHLIAIVLVWLVARRLIGRSWPAALAVLIFAVHPAYSDAVYWVVNGNTPLATICYLLAFLLFMRFTDGGRLRVLAYCGSLLAMLAAFLYHPAAATLIVVLPAWYFMVRHRPSKAFSWRSWLPFLPFFAITVPYVLIQQWVHDHDRFQSMYYRVGTHMFTNYRDYLGLALAPDTGTRTAAVGALLMIAITVSLCFQTKWRYTAPFAVLWFYLALGPDSVFTAGAYGRLLYLPGPPLAICLSLFVATAYDALARATRSFLRGSPRIAALSLGVIVAVCVTALLALPSSYVRSEPSQLLREQSALTHRFARELRRQDPPIAAGGTLYVVHPPPFLVHLNQETFLESLVQLYYGDVFAKTVPLRLSPYWDESQAQQMKGPDDRLFSFDLYAPSVPAGR